MLKKTSFLLFIYISLSAISYATPVKEGIWRGILLLNPQENTELPFNFEISRKNGRPILTIYNASEKIIVDEITQSDDSLNFMMPVFDSEFKTKNYGDSLVGKWINHAKKENNTIAFKARFNEKRRFIFEQSNSENLFNGKWEVTFSPGTTDSSKAIGVFNQKDKLITGTFLTETGDYRFLEGAQSKEKIYLSCFDGSHAFLFIASVKNNDIKGDFYSGSSWHESWIAKRNEAFQLKDPETITQLKNDLQHIYFSFPDLNGKKTSLSDSSFKNKVVIIQIMGSWCPNCMDETAYLSELYATHKNKGLEIIALAYERSSDKTKAINNLQRLKKRYSANYTFLLTGLSGKEKASESLPALNKISAFPTTIYIDRKGKVRKIYTGFSGPATGKEYEKFKHQTESFLNDLLKEK